MRKTTSPGHRSAVEFHAEKPMIVKPKTFGQKNIDGVLHYIGLDGKLYVASLFDRMFASAKQVIKGKFFKGNQIGKSFKTERV